MTERNDMSEINRIEQKIDIFMDSQNEFNRTVSKNLEKLSEAIQQNFTQQVEINQLNSHLTSIDAKQEKLTDRVSGIENKMTVAEEFRKDMKQWKFALFTASLSMFAAVVIWAFKTLVS